MERHGTAHQLDRPAPDRARRGTGHVPRSLLTGRTFALALTSPLGRAARTAELAGVNRAVPDPDLHEWDYGGYEGVTTREIHRTRPGWDLWTDGVPPGAEGHPGESPAEVGARADRVLARVGDALAGGDVVLVAHAHFLRVLAARRLRAAARRRAVVPAGDGHGEPAVDGARPAGRRGVERTAVSAVLTPAVRPGQSRPRWRPTI
ncbi:hypothetical protein GCM10020295_13110 [Streptomyces cinereospinus]